MISLFLSFILLFASPNTDVESFQGSIEMVLESHYETSYFTYFVKNENVRIDKFDCDHNLIQSLYVNLEKEKLYILSPDKKLYSEVPVKNDNDDNNTNYIIIKTENSRMVNDHLCYQWRVKNTERNTEVGYWVSQNNFYFFEDLLKLISSTDKTYEFFEKIPETMGFFPMLSVERTLLRKEKSRVTVVNISKKEVQDNMFSVPSDYNLVLY